MEDHLESLQSLLPANPAVVEFRRLTKRNVIQLGCSFCALFIAFNTMQSFESKLNKNLGLVALSSLYAAFSVCNLFAGAIVEFLGERIALFVGGLTYVAYLGANLYPRYFTLVPAAVILGWGASVLWAAQGSFLSKNCDDDTRGQYSGIFWALFQFNGVIGNLIAAVFLHFEHDNVTFLIVILFVIGAVANMSFLFLRPVPSNPTETIQMKEATSLSVKLLSCLRQFGDRRMVMLIPVFVYSGLSQSFFFSKFPQFVSLKTLGFVMASFAGANTISSMAMGRISDVVGRKPVLLLASFFALVGYGIAHQYDEFKPYSFFVAMAILGVSDAGYNTQMYAVVSTFKKDEAEAAFAFLKLFQASSTGIAFFYSLYLGFNTIVYIVGGACVLAIVSFFLLDSFVEKVDDKRQTIN